MKLLKTSFLLAAAATATQLDATDFNLSWSGASFSNGASATGVLSIDVPNAPATPSIFGSMPSWVTGITITVTGATSGNGTWTKSDFSGVVFAAGGVVDYTQPLTGQSVISDINFFRNSVGAPNGTGPNTLTLASGERITRTSGPSGVTDVAAWLSSINNQNRIYQTGVTLA